MSHRESSSFFYGFSYSVQQTIIDLFYEEQKINEYIAGKEKKRTESIKTEKNSRLDSCADTLCHCRVLWRLSDLSYWSVKQRELEYERLRQEETLSAATETVIAEPETEENTEETVIYCDPVYDSDSCMNRMKIFTHGSLCRERR